MALVHSCYQMAINMLENSKVVLWMVMVHINTRMEMKFKGYGNKVLWKNEMQNTNYKIQNTKKY